MKKLLPQICLAISVLPILIAATGTGIGTATAAAQDTMNHDDGQKTYESQKPIQLTGKISDTGQTFVTDSDGKSWSIINPEAVKGHEEHHVILTANVDADKNEVHVVSVQMARK